MSGTREGAIENALAFFDNGGFEQRLGKLVAIQSTSQEPAHRPDLDAYLAEIRPGSKASASPAPSTPTRSKASAPSCSPSASRARPTVLTYGHGDTVRGLEDQWEPGLDPWRLTRRDDRWYGRGSADNKGQHVINLSALEAVLAERGGKLGFNLKLIVETGEESGSKGLSEIVAANKENSPPTSCSPATARASTRSPHAQHRHPRLASTSISSSTSGPAACTPATGAA